MSGPQPTPTPAPGPTSQDNQPTPPATGAPPGMLSQLQAVRQETPTAPRHPSTPMPPPSAPAGPAQQPAEAPGPVPASGLQHAVPGYAWSATVPSSLPGGVTPGETPKRESTPMPPPVAGSPVPLAAPAPPLLPSAPVAVQASEPLRVAQPAPSPSFMASMQADNKQHKIREQQGIHHARAARAGMADDLGWSMVTIVLSFIVFLVSLVLFVPFGLVSVLRGSDRVLLVLVWMIGIIMAVALGLLAYEVYHVLGTAMGGVTHVLFGDGRRQSGLAPAPQAVPATLDARASADGYAYASPPGNMAGGAREHQPAGETTGQAGPGDETDTPTAPEPIQAEPPPPVPAVPGGTIVGYGQRVEPAAWTEKPKKADGFPPVGDFDQVALSARGWAVVGSSRIGRGHLQDGKYREDAIAAEIVDGKWHLAAVADGGGSYKLARLGARMAVAAAVRSMKQAIYLPHGADDNERVRYVVETGLRDAYQAIYGEAERLRIEEERKQAGVAVTVKDLRTTLLLVVHHELEAGRGHLVGGGQVGDGAVVARIVESGKPRLVWLSEPDTGPQGNETVFLTDVPNTDEDWARRVSFQHLYGDVVYCLAMTDGVSDDFVPLEDNLERLEKPMFQMALGENDLAMAAQKLEELLRYERQGSFDDRSLICIYKQGAAPWK